MAFAPALVAALPTIATVASTAIGIAGVIMTTSANMEAANYRAEVARRNAEIMEMNAQNAIQRSQMEQIQQEEITRSLLGEQIAAQSASGLKLGGRSQMLTRKSAREIGRRDALNVRHAGEIEAYNFRVAAQDAQSEAGFLRQTARNAQLAGFLEGAGTLVGGLGKLKFDSGGSLLGTRKLSKMTVPSTQRLKFT